MSISFETALLALGFAASALVMLWAYAGSADVAAREPGKRGD